MDRIDSATIKRLSREVGFDICGIVAPQLLPDDGERLRLWLEKGYHGEMEYLGRDLERRSDPKLLMPEVRSIIVLGLNYFQENTEDPPPEGHGRVSRYARGRDYHKIIEKLSKQLIGRIAEVGQQNEESFRWFVDYGPILERAYAERAGLGFIGKNSMLINRKYGSWLFLAEILTSLELEPDDPDSIDHGSCAECSLCIDSCPTGAIVAEKTIDSSKCLSYLAIERPGEIKDESARQMGRNVFGCDICQEVCPLNRQAIVTGHKDLLPESGVGEFVNARAIVEMRTREQFLELTAGTPLTRPKLEGLRRNAEIALENEQREER